MLGLGFGIQFLLATRFVSSASVVFWVILWWHASGIFRICFCLTGSGPPERVSWTTKVPVEADVGSVVIEASSKDPSPRVHLAPSCLTEFLSLLLFGSLYVACLFLRFLLRVLSSLPSPFSSHSLLTPVSHGFLSAAAAVGRSSGWITSMDFSNEIPESLVGGDNPVSLSSGKGHFPK